MKVHSLLFLHPVERKKVMKENTQYEGVTESSIIISNEFSKDEVKINKEEYIKEVTEVCNTVQETERVQHLMNIVLDKTYVDDRIYKTIISNSKHLPSTVTKSLYTTLTSVLQHRYKSDFCPNDPHERDLHRTLVLCDKIEDVRKLVEDSNVSEYEKTIREELEGIKTLLSTQVSYHKHLVELQYNLLLNASKLSNISWLIDLVYKLKDNNSTGTMSFEEAISSIRNSTNFKNYLEQRKNEMNNEINIITVDEDYIKPLEPSARNFEIVPTVMSNLRGGVIPYDKLNMLIGKTSTLQMSPVDIFKYKSVKSGKEIERVNTTCGQREVCVAYDNMNVEIVSVDIETGDTLYVPLIRNLMITPNMEYLLGDNNMYTIKDCDVIRIKYRDKKDHGLDTLTEGLKFTEDGGVKLTYKPKSSYMDDYSRINKVIVQNARNQNIEGVKTDLVFLFSFINELEKITKGRVKVKDSTMEDAKKAKMFANGDFKQYLAFVQERDPSFNFSKYFEDNYKNEDKVMVEFSNQDIRGFKLLLRTILG